MDIKINKPIKEHKAGTIITVKPTNPEYKYWLRRLEDAKIDNCCEILEEKAIEVEPETKAKIKKENKSIKIMIQ